MKGSEYFLNALYAYICVCMYACVRVSQWTFEYSSSHSPASTMQRRLPSEVCNLCSSYALDRASGQGIKQDWWSGNKWLLIFYWLSQKHTLICTYHTFSFFPHTYLFMFTQVRWGKVSLYSCPVWYFLLICAMWQCNFIKSRKKTKNLDHLSSSLLSKISIGHFLQYLNCFMYIY